MQFSDKVIISLKNIKRHLVGEDLNLLNYQRLELTMLQELYWAQVYESTITDSTWLQDKSVSPGRWAAGYNFLYVLYRILNDVNPVSILELGLGQTTKLTTQYVSYNNLNSRHIIVEHDSNWADFFLSKWKHLSPRSQLKYSDLKKGEMNGELYWEYQNFPEIVKNQKFDLLCIDGPWGNASQIYGRRDLLPFIPSVLMDNFVILIDDCGRKGEQNTILEIETSLKKNDIKYSITYYDGFKNKVVTCIASNSWRFLCSL